MRQGKGDPYEARKRLSFSRLRGHPETAGHREGELAFPREPINQSKTTAAWYRPESSAASSYRRSGRSSRQSRTALPWSGLYTGQRLGDRWSLADCVDPATTKAGESRVKGWIRAFTACVTRLFHCSRTLAPDSVVMALVGHESTAMSHRYTHVGKEALARAAKTLPEI